MNKIPPINLNTFLESFYEGVRVDKIIDGVCRDPRYKKDLKQDLFILLYSMDKTKLQKLIHDGEFYGWCWGFLQNQYVSNRSEFFYNYRNMNGFNDGFDIPHLDDIYGDVKVQTLLQHIDEILNDEIDWFHAFLFREYYFEWWDNDKDKMITKGLSYRSIEEKYKLNDDMKIDHMFIFTSVKSTLKLVKKKLKKKGLI